MDRPRNRARKPGNVRLRRRKDNPAPLCTRTSSQPCDRVKDLQKRCAANLCDRSACLQHARLRERSSTNSHTRAHGDETARACERGRMTPCYAAHSICQAALSQLPPAKFTPWPLMRTHGAYSRMKRPHERQQACSRRAADIAQAHSGCIICCRKCCCRACIIVL